MVFGEKKKGVRDGEVVLESRWCIVRFCFGRRLDLRECGGFCLEVGWDLCFGIEVIVIVVV